ncbi:hypothetical protein [Kangiella sp. TOML190]|uniref:hypothetical protein n=1 Tax=Kangiella sp. TOML190 TaxID=2931351 RepID=UPI00203FF6B2|nr:hypothetical protein [Kangiella sp. TOML190]
MSSILLVFAIPVLAIFALFSSLKYRKQIGLGYFWQLVISSLLSILGVLLSFIALDTMTSGRASLVSGINPYLFVGLMCIAGLYCFIISIITLAKAHQAKLALQY